MPKIPWEVIGIDSVRSVRPLPESSNHNRAFNMIAVVICLLTGMVHLVSCWDNYTTKEVAGMVFLEIYNHHETTMSYCVLYCQ